MALAPKEREFYERMAHDSATELAHIAKMEKPTTMGEFLHVYRHVLKHGNAEAIAYANVLQTRYTHAHDELMMPSA